MNDRILFVDDEPNVLAAIERQLRKLYSVYTAAGGGEGLATLEAEGPFAVVVSDMKMPGMSGAAFLTQVREKEPDSVRMVLSGQAELDAAITAVNDGGVFRFLTKPCRTEALVGAIEAGLEQHRLVLAERELLEETLSGTVKLLTEVLALVNPDAFSRATRIKRYVEQMAEDIGSLNSWEIGLAGMLSQLGCVAIPQQLVQRVLLGDELDSDEQAAFAKHPEVAEKLLRRIPRLGTVAGMVGGHLRTAPTTVSTNVNDWPVRTLGAQLLRAAGELDRLVASGEPVGSAIARVRTSAELPQVIRELVAKIQVENEPERTAMLSVADVRTGMIIDQDLHDEAGVLLVACGQEVTDTVLLRLRNYKERDMVQEPFKVRVPASSVYEAA